MTDDLFGASNAYVMWTVSWASLNMVSFYVPELGWRGNPLLVVLETMALAFLCACVVDSFTTSPKKKYNSGGKLGGMQEFLKAMRELLPFAAIWVIEITITRTLMSQDFRVIGLFRDISMYAEPDNPPVPGPLCLPSDILFSMRQFVLIVAYVILVWRSGRQQMVQPSEAIPIVVMSISAALVVLGDTSTIPSIQHALMMVVWVFVRSYRLLSFKSFLDRQRHNGLVLCVRNIAAVMFVFLLPVFCVFEGYGDVNVYSPAHNSLRDMLTETAHHLTYVGLLVALYVTSIAVCYHARSTLDFITLVTTRDVLWNTSCSHVMEKGIRFVEVQKISTLRPHQILAFVVYMVCLVTRTLFSMLETARQTAHLREKTP